MEFPLVRMRRLRRTEALRRMVREAVLHPADLVQPLFAVSGQGVRTPIASMPGVEKRSPDGVAEAAQRAWAAGVPAVSIVGLPSQKDAEGSSSWSQRGVVQEATRAVKKAVPDMCVIADVGFGEYTDHGHCGVMVDGDVDNDATLENLARQAVSLAEAGADILAPQGMMDGMVAALREALDDSDFESVPIMSSAVEYASALYGPFREVAGSAPVFGDRDGYQMDPANSREAIREAQLDVAEGADMLMVKPAMAYLDLVRDLKEEFELPVAAFSVSGELAMVEAAVAHAGMDRRRLVLETLTSMKRAGADLIVTYWATEAAEWLKR